MKTYTVELKRTSFITLTVEADSVEDAETKAWAELESGGDDTTCADWEVESIEEQEHVNAR